jgi:hypothetical protein
MLPENENKSKNNNALRNIVIAFFFLVFVMLFLKVIFF